MKLEGLDSKRAADNNIQVDQILHMNQGDGDYSYAKHALIQKKAISKAKPLIQESISELCCNNIPECLNFADLGCSLGPNAYLPTCYVIEALLSTCHCLNHKPPTLQVFLNDLPGNDFNTTFKLLPTFFERLKRERGDEFGQFCFINAVPGSFYKRLFPSHSLHFVFSSFAVHWLSQVPKGLMSELEISLNKRNVYVAKTSPPDVHKAYLDQFETDFTTFLKLRSKELKPGGRMVLALKGQQKHQLCIWEIFGDVIKDMVSEGLVEESKLESFNMPFYAPSTEEIRLVIEEEGSFDIHNLETFQQSWWVNLEKETKLGLELDTYEKAKQVVTRFRSVGESILASHFGNGVMDEMYSRLSIKVDEILEMGLGEMTNLLVSLIKK